MNISELNNRKSYIKEQISKIDELINLLCPSFNNDFIDEKAKRETEKYINERNTLCTELIGIENKINTANKFDEFKVRECNDQLLSHINIDDTMYNKILDDVILSKNAKIEYKSTTETIDDEVIINHYIIISDPSMLILYDHEDFNVDDNALKKIRSKYNWAINFNQKQINDIVIKFGHAWLRKYAWIFMNRCERPGDYGKLRYENIIRSNNENKLF